VTAEALPVGADGRRRCSWAGQAPIYTAYHDEEWGRPVHGEGPLFERITLEAFQSGLSWLTILRKREGFRRAFAGFDPEQVAAFDDGDVARLLDDASIVRNRAKVRAAITNAAAVLRLREAGGLDAVFWSLAYRSNFMEDMLTIERWFMDPKNHKEVTEIAGKMMKAPPERFDWLFTKKDYYRNPDMLPDLKALQANIDLTHQLGFIKAPLDVQKYTDLSLVQEAAKRLK